MPDLTAEQKHCREVAVRHWHGRCAVECDLEKKWIAGGTDAPREFTKLAALIERERAAAVEQYRDRIEAYAREMTRTFASVSHESWGWSIDARHEEDQRMADLVSDLLDLAQLNDAPGSGEHRK